VEKRNLALTKKKVSFQKRVVMRRGGYRKRGEKKRVSSNTRSHGKLAGLSTGRNKKWRRRYIVDSEENCCNQGRKGNRSGVGGKIIMFANIGEEIGGEVGKPRRVTDVFEGSLGDCVSPE